MEIKLIRRPMCEYIYEPKFYLWLNLIFLRFRLRGFITLRLRFVQSARFVIYPWKRFYLIRNWLIFFFVQLAWQKLYLSKKDMNKYLCMKSGRKWAAKFHSSTFYEADRFLNIKCSYPLAFILTRPCSLELASPPSEDDSWL